MSKTIAELKGMQRAQLNRMNKEVLIESILNAGGDDSELQLGEQLAKISSELAQLRDCLTSPNSPINQKISSMQNQIDQQARVIEKQQQFLEAIDRRERETKLVLLGVPDEGVNLAGATTDGEKINNIWGEIGEEVRIRGHRRLGRRDANSTRRRPILVEVESRQARDAVLDKARKLKEKGQDYKLVYIKKDVHPSVRNEWKRLREAEKAEKERPENVGCVIRLDTRERKLYRDEVVIDSWNASFF